jgi:hypothetical protein
LRRLMGIVPDRQAEIMMAEPRRCVAPAQRFPGRGVDIRRCTGEARCPAPSDCAARKPCARSRPRAESSSRDHPRVNSRERSRPSNVLGFVAAMRHGGRRRRTLAHCCSAVRFGKVSLSRVCHPLP